MNLHAVKPQEDEEIGLTELIAKLWRGRWTIASITGSTVMLACVYAFNSPQVWTSMATIAPPSIEQMGEYYLAKRQLDAAPLFSKPDGRVSVSVQSTPTPTPTPTSAEAEQAGQLFEVTKLLLDTTPGVMLLRPDGRKQQLFQVQSSAQTPAAAQQQLNQAFKLINRQLATQKAQELRSQRNLLQASLRQEQEELVSQAKAIRTKELAQTRLALDTAKRAGLINFNGNSYAGLEAAQTHYLLGSKLLQARLTTLEHAPLDYPERYYEINDALKEIQKLPKVGIGNLAGFQLISEPSLPSHRDKPKRSLIIALAAIVGLLLGSLWILGHDVLAELRDKLKD
ncbi:Wzz/FepE/Etk N-terminal domain-containing protein [Vogesella amnigena]|uniref:Wzz/FepE/Etk N-terminal domain-containing protein n=1 Tax=Vogesella amnigena TaxID=1507449 RepID=A0ABV7TU57_9NEIS